MLRIFAATACALAFLAPIGITTAQQRHVTAETGGIAIGGNVINSTIHDSPEEIAQIVRLRTQPLELLTETQRQFIGRLQADLDLNQRQIHAALEIVGEANVPPERLAAKLVEFAERFKALQASASIQHSDAPKVAALKADAQKAIDAGELARADALLADAETEQGRDYADTTARRGAIALIRLRYTEAARHFARAAAVLPTGNDYDQKRIEYLEKEAGALYQQGDEFGDNSALRSAIERSERLLELQPRARVPLDWAATQNNLGLALLRLGERESGTARLEEAVAAYRAALEETTRARVPLDWAMTQMNLGSALRTLGERESGTARLEEAVAAYRAALEEWTRARVPLDWAMTQMNLGIALWRLGERESGTARLEEAVAAYQAALEERTRARVAERRGDLAMAEQALAQITAAFETLRAADHVNAGYYEAQLPATQALVERLRKR
jgi:tetratricopeptide (TPR) repeat protein